MGNAVLGKCIDNRIDDEAQRGRGAAFTTRPDAMGMRAGRHLGDEGLQRWHRVGGRMS